MKSKKYTAVIILLILTIAISYSLPKTKYVGTGFISRLNVPKSINGWTGRDVTGEVGLNLESDKYGFVSEALAYQYVNSEGKSLLFIILDAGNFHHPKVCFTGAGFKIKELSDTEFRLQNNTIKTHTLFTERGKDTFLTFYWIVIDKNVAHEWVEQKIKQLWFSLFGKKRVGLMVRVDIPTKEDNIGDARILAKEFLNEINKSLDSADYIFGEK